MKQLQHFEDAITEMNENGVTLEDLRTKHHLTEWGARKFVEKLGHEEEKDPDSDVGEPAKIHYTDYTPRTLPKSLKAEPMPVKTNNTEINREAQHEKQKQTNEVKEHVIDLEKTVKEIEPGEIEWDKNKNSANGVDIIWHETDTHLGALVEDAETGEIVFNTPRVKEIMAEKRENFAEYVHKEARDNSVDTIHWLLAGDIIEGTGIYGGQAHETDLYINKQIEEAGEELVKTFKHIHKICEDYDAQLQIVCIPGNHGDMRISSADNKANFDDIVYHLLHQAINMFQDMNNVDQSRVRVKRSDSYVGTTFPVRNMTGYVSHGQHMKKHVGTSSGERDALAIMNEYGADALFRGHYHMPKIEDVNGTPVIMTNSIKPGSMYEDSIKAFGNPGYSFYTAADDEFIKNARNYRVSKE